MGARAIDRRKLRKVGNSFVTGLIHSELEREGLIEQNDDGEWEPVEDDLEVVVRHNDDGTAELEFPTRE